MNIEEIKEHFRLTPEEVNRMEEFVKKAEKAQVLFCDLHDKEWFDFEDGCPACLEETKSFLDEMRWKERNSNTTTAT